MARRVLWGVALVVLALALGAEVVQAQSGGNESVKGIVRNERLDDKGERQRDPVPGVAITVATVEGVEVGSAVTDADGAFEIPLPEPADYVVKLDDSTLPDGVSLRDEAQKEQTIEVRPNETQRLNYFLGESTRETQGRWASLPQTLANGVRFGLIIAISAIGLSLIYGTTGLSNFAHGELVTLGAIICWYANVEWFGGLNFFIAAALGILAAAAAGFGFEAGVFRPLRRRGIGLTSAMIVTIGIGIAARYLYQFIFGGRSRPYRQFALQNELDLGPFSLTPRDLAIMVICLFTLLGVGLYLQYARKGKAIRAVSDNPDLAEATGIDVDGIIRLVWVAGAGLAGLGGILLGLDQQVRWDMGFGLLLLMFAAITVGGLGNPYGALVGALLIGVLVELWPWVFPSAAELKALGALLALIIVLLVRPQGLLGRKERVG